MLNLRRSARGSGGFSKSPLGFGCPYLIKMIEYLNLLGGSGKFQPYYPYYMQYPGTGAVTDYKVSRPQITQDLKIESEGNDGRHPSKYGHSSV